MEINMVNVQGYETLLLDRDGTINVHVIGDYVRTWEDFQFIPIALQTMPYFAKHFKHIFIVTINEELVRENIPNRTLRMFIRR